MRKFLTCAAVTMLLFIACKKEQQVVTDKAGEVKADWTSDNSSSNYTSKAYSPYTGFIIIYGGKILVIQVSGSIMETIEASGPTIQIRQV